MGLGRSDLDDTSEQNPLVRLRCSQSFQRAPATAFRRGGSYPFICCGGISREQLDLANCERLGCLSNAGIRTLGL